MFSTKHFALPCVLLALACSTRPGFCLVPEKPSNAAPATTTPDTQTPATGPSPAATPAPRTPTTEVLPGQPPDTTSPDTKAPATTPGGGTEPITGTEPAGDKYTLTSPQGVIYDMARGLAVARGEVTFTYGQFTVTGDRGVVDYNTNRATIAGNLKVTVRDQKFEGKTLVFELDTRRWTLSAIETVFPPDYFPEGTVLEPIYLSEGEISGQDDNVSGRNFEISSCDRDHYYLKTKRVDFYRDQRGEITRIAARKNALYVFGHKIIPLPVYVVSLTGQRSRNYGLKPTFGQDAVNGFFVKSIYDLRAGDKLTDSLLLDAFQKRGLGLGITRELAEGAGLFTLYALTGKAGGREINAEAHRTWKITPSLTSILNFTSSKNSTSSLSPGVSNQNGDLTFNLNRTRVQSSLALRQNSTGSGFGDFKSFGVTLQHRQDLSQRLTFEGSSLYNSNSFGTFSSSKTLDNTFMFTQRASRFDTSLRTELHDSLADNNLGGSYQLERIPELSFTTDTTRLKWEALRRIAPGNLRMEIGHFSEPTFALSGSGSGATRQKKTRYDLNYNMNPRTSRLLRVGSFLSELRSAARFDQAFYSDNTARYNYEYLFTVDNRLGPLSVQANYGKQRPIGFTPFQFDFLTPGEYLDTTLTYRPSTKFGLDLSGGRDIRNGVSRDILGTLKFSPSPSFYTSLAASYSPETHRYGDVIGNLRLDRNAEKFLGGLFALGVRFSPASNEITRINLQTDLTVTRGTRLQALSSYNGFSKQFDFNQIRVSRDLHCFNLYLTYDQQRKQVRFDLALKAFPFFDTNYGKSRFGEGQDALIGDVR
ncbi:MAG: hypothetical protein M3347_02350 [Armatimonadota bacterium]|nr:hypothetical protein [Armatimonadota bacterium]